MERYNRNYRKRRSGAGFTIFIFIIVLALVVGYAGTKFVLYPYLLNNSQIEESDGQPGIDTNVNSDENTDADDKVDSTKPKADADTIINTSVPSIIIDQQNITELDKVSISDSKGPFTVQFGSFATADGAEVLSSELTAKGIYSYVLESDGSHKVLGLPYSEKSKAQEAMTIVSTEVADAFVVDMASLIK